MRSLKELYSILLLAVREKRAEILEDSKVLRECWDYEGAFVCCEIDDLFTKCKISVFEFELLKKDWYNRKEEAKEFTFKKGWIKSWKGSCAWWDCTPGGNRLRVEFVNHVIKNEP